MELTERDRQRFETNPARFIEDTIESYTADSPKNRLVAIDNTPIFDQPLVGFADGDDPLFQQYKKIIGDFHFTPREALEAHLRNTGKTTANQLARVSVIAWILPISRETRLSMRQETQVPSLRWNHTRWQGEEFNSDLSLYLVSVMEKLGYPAVAPMYSELWHMLEQANGLTSNWSHRHIAYACGLGTFSLNDSFITARGVANRCGSIVVGIALPSTPLPNQDHLANCLFYQDKSCKRCIERCPAGAITEAGHDKKKCHVYLTEQKNLLRKLGREEGYIGRFPACGLCQTKVPCEDRIPPPAASPEPADLR